MNRALYSAAMAAVAVLATLFVTTGTAAAATPGLTGVHASSSSYLSPERKYRHWDWDHNGKNYGGHHHADASEINHDYFGGDYGGSGGGSYLACPNAPAPGVSGWTCHRVYLR